MDAAAALIVLLVVFAAACARGAPENRLAALVGASNTAVLTLLLVSAGFDRAAFADLAIALAVLGFVGNLAFARFLERWL
jgi:multisubunit Na+/H+ antiporter MnhF subunit